MAHTTLDEKLPMPTPKPGLRLAFDFTDEGNLFFETQTSATQMVPLLLTNEQYQINVDYINHLLVTDERCRRSTASHVDIDEGDQAEAALEDPANEAPEQPLRNGQPTPGLRVEVFTEEATRENDPIAHVGTKRNQYSPDGRVSTPAEWSQAGVDAAYINWLLETDERRRTAQKQQMVGTSDVLVDLGDMKDASITSINIDDEGFEAMTEDVLGNFNHIVTQGITPITAIYALAMGFTIALGACLRANMSDTQADALLAIVRNNAKAEARRLKVITKQ